MTLGIILLFLIEAHICDVKEFIDGTCHIHITHPKTRTYYTQSTETHYQIRTIIIAMHTTCVLAILFSLFRSIFNIFFTGTNLFFLLSSSSTVRQDGKSYFIGSVHIINIQKFMCVFVTDKTILRYTCLHHICIPVTVMPLVFVSFNFCFIRMCLCFFSLVMFIKSLIASAMCIIECKLINTYIFFLSQIQQTANSKWKLKNPSILYTHGFKTKKPALKRD